jgi:hypothetical protein
MQTLPHLTSLAKEDETGMINLNDYAGFPVQSDLYAGAAAILYSALLTRQENPSMREAFCF